MIDEGEWTVEGVAKGSPMYLQSSDFDCDAIITVNGDFETYTHQIKYYEELAERLNATRFNLPKL